MNLHQYLYSRTRDQLRRVAKAAGLPCGRNKSDTVYILAEHVDIWMNHQCTIEFFL